MDKNIFENLAAELHKEAGLEWNGFKNGDASILSTFRQGLKFKINWKLNERKKRRAARWAKENGFADEIE